MRNVVLSPAIYPATITEFLKELYNPQEHDCCILSKTAFLVEQACRCLEHKCVCYECELLTGGCVDSFEYISDEFIEDCNNIIINLDRILEGDNGYK